MIAVGQTRSCVRVYLARAAKSCRMSLGVLVHVSCSRAGWAELSGKPERSIDKIGRPPIILGLAHFEELEVTSSSRPLPNVLCFKNPKFNFKFTVLEMYFRKLNLELMLNYVEIPFMATVVLGDDSTNCSKGSHRMKNNLVIVINSKALFRNPVKRFEINLGDQDQLI